MKRWKLLPAASEEFIQRFAEVSSRAAQLLFNRGLDTQQKVDEFLNPDYQKDLHDPFLFQDMEKAVERIYRAIVNNEKIAVHGDYDADGVTSSVVLILTFRRLISAFGGDANNLSVYIPHREKEGYGLNPDTVQYFKEQKIDLVVTCDCGISQIAEGKLCQEAGIDLIITDHHQEPKELPTACAIINPNVKSDKYPDAGLSGVGVAFKLAQGLFRRLNNYQDKIKENFNTEAFEKWLLDLVSIGTVADCSPLLGENRTLVKYGLIVLNKTPRLGLKRLFATAGIGKNGNGVNGNGLDQLPKQKGILNTYSIGFQIAPRINAAGRLDHANVAYELMITEEEAVAEKLAARLQAQNQERQKLTEQMLEEAKAQIKEQVGKNKLLFAIGQGWKTGVVGLVAGKLVELYYRPVFVMGRNKGEIVGSGRSIPEFNEIKALQEVDKYLDRYGGHAMACGFTLKSIDDFYNFQNDLLKVANRELAGVDLSPEVEVEAEITLKELNWELFKELEQMEPFGDANPRPIFLLKKARVSDLSPVGVDNKHLRLIVSDGEITRKTIAFGFGDWYRQLKIGDNIDLVVELGVNEWNGNRELQLKVVDLRLAIG